MEIQDLKTEEERLKEEGFSQQDKDEIFDQIDQIAQKNKIHITPEIFEVRTHKGNIFPWLVNIIALITIPLAFYIISRYFTQKENSITLETNTYFSGEGQLISEVIKESEAKLEAKQGEINKIKSELNNINAQQEALLNNMQNQITEKEEELRSQYEIALEEERQRLIDQGMAQSEITKLLEEWEQQKKQELSTTLENFKASAAQELEEKETDLKNTRLQLENVLESAEQEQQRLIEETNRTKEESEALKNENEQITDELDRLMGTKLQEDLYTDQLIQTYQQIKYDLETGNKTKANEDLLLLTSLIDDISTKKLPSLKKRIETERFVISLISTLLLDTEDSPWSQNNLLLDSLDEKIAEATELKAKGQQQEASKVFNDVITTFDAINTAHTQLNEIKDEIQQAKLNEAYKTAQLDGNKINSYLNFIREFFPDPIMGKSLTNEIANDWEQKNSQLEVQKSELANSSIQITSLERENQELSDNLNMLETVITNNQERIDYYEEYAIQLSDLTSKYVTISKLIEDNIENNNDKELQQNMSQLGTLFNTNIAQNILPNIGHNYQVLIDYIQNKTKQEIAFNNNDSVNDILRVIKYMSGSENLTEEDKTILEDQIQDNQELNDIIEELRTLAIRGQKSSLQSKEYLLLGAVSYKLNDSIIVERLTDILVTDKQKVQFRRQIKGESVIIAEGEIRSFEGSKVLTNISSIIDQEPRSGDIVFVEMLIK
ncbi:hypothetical protein [Spirochaeta cellobiosiphila]|uniref:hypothetical protein n=1 Tax=Spirochaeta cellobiosiphila TaxID=504483 RepID=UPI000422F3E5|nr:hypothetical protein [Spirochaeta cellobiosiphila]